MTGINGLNPLKKLISMDFRHSFEIETQIVNGYSIEYLVKWGKMEYKGL
jgi:hypothetical protein